MLGSEKSKNIKGGIAFNKNNKKPAKKKKYPKFMVNSIQKMTLILKFEFE